VFRMVSGQNKPFVAETMEIKKTDLFFENIDS
jgi:hypothetical protein